MDCSFVFLFPYFTDALLHFGHFGFLFIILSPFFEVHHSHARKCPISGTNCVGFGISATLILEFHHLGFGKLRHQGSGTAKHPDFVRVLVGNCLILGSFWAFFVCLGLLIGLFSYCITMRRFSPRLCRRCRLRRLYRYRCHRLRRHRRRVLRQLLQLRQH